MNLATVPIDAMTRALTRVHDRKPAVTNVVAHPTGVTIAQVECGGTCGHDTPHRVAILHWGGANCNCPAGLARNQRVCVHIAALLDYLGGALPEVAT